MKKISNDVISQFGKPVYECSSYYNAESRLTEVKRFYNKIIEDNNSDLIDNVTWDDLDMDEMFLRINHTESFVGEQTLYYRLHKIFSDQDFEDNISILSFSICISFLSDTSFKMITYLFDFIESASYLAISALYTF